MHNVLWGCAEILPYLRAVVFFLSSIEIVPLFVFYAPFQLFAHTSACSEEAVKKSGNPNVMMKNPSDMENQVFLKAKTRVSVLFTLLDILAWLEIFVFVMRIVWYTIWSRTNRYTACLYLSHLEECFFSLEAIAIYYIINWNIKENPPFFQFTKWRVWFPSTHFQYALYSDEFSVS